jgi:predicted Zn-dependent protease
VSAPGTLAERALGAVGGIEPLHVRVVRERSLLLRFARSRPTQATAIDDTTVEITALRDGHTAAAVTNRGDPEALADCVRAAGEAADAAARSGPGSYPGFPAPSPGRPHHGYDGETARLDPARGGTALETAFAVAERRGLEAHGVWTAAEVETAIASTSGDLVGDVVTDAFMKVTCLGPDGRSGYAAATGVSLDALDAAGLAESAAVRASGALAPNWSGGPPARLDPGEYPVVLEPDAVAELAWWLGSLAFNGLAYVEQRSPLVDRMRTRVAAPSINLADSPRHPRTLPRAFDAEGVAKAPLPLIQDGVAHRVVHDTHSAALAGARSTGHAERPGGSQGGPRPSNMVLAGGGAADSAELCRPIDRGVYVTRLWYTNAVRPKETLITGVTRDGTFLIENGEIAAPLEDLRLTDSVLDVFGRVQDLGSNPTLASEGEFYGRRFATGVVCPPLRVASMRFTGRAPGG